MDSLEQLASYRRCNERICGSWRTFQDTRRQRLLERERFGHAAERATESIIEDLFTLVLDWTLGNINHQVGYADILLTRLGTKVKWPTADSTHSRARRRPTRARALGYDAAGSPNFRQCISDRCVTDICLARKMPRLDGTSEAPTIATETVRCTPDGSV